MADKARWKQISKRRWDEIAPVWVEVATSVPTLLAKPSPGVEKLPGLLGLGSEDLKLYEDVEGLRQQVFWEALFLFAKCDHAKIASERLAEVGMASWAMFNAYHSAYLGARSILWLLGVPLPDLAGRQVLLDIFPEEDAKVRKRRGSRPLVYQEFLLKNIKKLDQRGIWDCLKRVIRVSDVNVWDRGLVQEIERLEESTLTPPRNHFLYKAGYWIFEDLEQDLAPGFEWMSVSDPVVPSDRSFLLWLCFAIHRLLTQLLDDMAARSGLLAAYLSTTRTKSASNMPSQIAYTQFCVGRGGVGRKSEQEIPGSLHDLRRIGHH